MQQHEPLLLFSVGADGSIAHVDSGILDEVARILWDRDQGERHAAALIAHDVHPAPWPS
jgi:hypothetical protein